MFSPDVEFLFFLFVKFFLTNVSLEASFVILSSWLSSLARVSFSSSWKSVSFCGASYFVWSSNASFSTFEDSGFVSSTNASFSRSVLLWNTCTQMLQSEIKITTRTVALSSYVTFPMLAFPSLYWNWFGFLHQRSQEHLLPYSSGSLQLTG